MMRLPFQVVNRITSRLWFICLYFNLLLKIGIDSQGASGNDFISIRPAFLHAAKGSTKRVRADYDSKYPVQTISWEFEHRITDEKFVLIDFPCSRVISKAGNQYVKATFNSSSAPDCTNGTSILDLPALDGKLNGDLVFAIDRKGRQKFWKKLDLLVHNEPLDVTCKVSRNYTTCECVSFGAYQILSGQFVLQNDTMNRKQCDTAGNILKRVDHDSIPVYQQSCKITEILPGEVYDFYLTVRNVSGKIEARPFATCDDKNKNENDSGEKDKQRSLNWKLIVLLICLGFFIVFNIYIIIFLRRVYHLHQAKRNLFVDGMDTREVVSKIQQTTFGTNETIRENSARSHKSKKGKKDKKKRPLSNQP